MSIATSSITDATVAMDTVTRDAGAALLGGVTRAEQEAEVIVLVLHKLLLQQNSHPTLMVLPPVRAGVQMSPLVEAQLRVID